MLIKYPIFVYDMICKMSIGAILKSISHSFYEKYGNLLFNGEDIDRNYVRMMIYDISTYDQGR